MLRGTLSPSPSPSPSPLLLLLLLLLLLSSPRPLRASTPRSLADEVAPFEPRCYREEAFCFFSVPPDMTKAADIEEAQSVCEAAMPNSWVPAPLDPRLVEVLRSYMLGVERLRQASILVLANKFNGPWEWTIDERVTGGKLMFMPVIDDVLISMKEVGGMLIFQPGGDAPPPEDYDIVCTIGCWSEETVYSDMTYPGGTFVQMANRVQCGMICETLDSCFAWSWLEFNLTESCFVHNASKELVSSPGEVLSVIDKSTKIIDRCMYGLELEFEPEVTEKPNVNETGLEPLEKPKAKKKVPKPRKKSIVPKPRKKMGPTKMLKGANAGSASAVVLTTIILVAILALVSLMAFLLFKKKKEPSGVSKGSSIASGTPGSKVDD